MRRLSEIHAFVDLDRGIFYRHSSGRRITNNHGTSGDRLPAAETSAIDMHDTLRLGCYDLLGGLGNATAGERVAGQL